MPADEEGKRVPEVRGGEGGGRTEGTRGEGGEDGPAEGGAVDEKGGGGEE